MPRRCSVCDHGQREQIDLALASGDAAVRVAAKFRVSDDAVSRHFANHVGLAAARVQRAVHDRAVRETAHDFDILAEVHRRTQHADELVKAAESLVARASAEQDWKTAVSAVGAATRALSEARACLELQARLAGQLNEQSASTTVNVNLEAEWPVLRQRIIVALEPHPDARLAVLTALNERNGDAAH